MMRISSSWARGVKVNREGRRREVRALGSWEKEEPVWRGWWDRYLPEDPAVDVSGHLTGMNLGQWSRARVWELCARSAALTTIPSPLTVSRCPTCPTVKKDCTDTINSIDAPPPSWVVLGESWGFCFSILLLTDPLTRLL